MPELARLPLARLDAAPGELRTMIRIGRHSMHRAPPQAQLEPLEELRPAFGLGKRVAEHSRGVPGKRDEVPGLYADRFDRARKSERSQPLAQQPAKALGVACGRGQADFDALLFEKQPERADPRMAGGQ